MLRYSKLLSRKYLLLKNRTQDNRAYNAREFCPENSRFAFFCLLNYTIIRELERERSNEGSWREKPNGDSGGCVIKLAMVVVLVVVVVCGVV